MKHRETPSQAAVIVPNRISYLRSLVESLKLTLHDVKSNSQASGRRAKQVNSLANSHPRGYTMAFEFSEMWLIRFNLS